MLIVMEDATDTVEPGVERRPLDRDVNHQRVHIGHAQNVFIHCAHDNNRRSRRQGKVFAHLPRGNDIAQIPTHGLVLRPERRGVQLGLMDGKGIGGNDMCALHIQCRKNRVQTDIQW